MTPKGWKQEKLGDLFEFKNGVNTEAANYGTGIKFVNVMDVFENSSLICEKIRGSVNVTDEKIDLYKLQMGDVLFNRTSETFNEIALSTVYLDSKPAIFGGFVIRGRPTSNNLNADFCVYCFLSNNVRKELIRRGQGAIRANIGQSDMRNIPLLVPPLSEQKKIARILSTWDKAIETVEKLIENSKAQKKTLMQQLLRGKRRLPGFEGEWKTIKLSTLCKIGRGASPRPIKDPKWFSESGRGWVRISDITASPTHELLSTKQYLSKEGTQNSVCVDPGDLIMSICGTIGVPKFLGIPACIHDGFVVFRNCSRNISLAFLYHFLDFISKKLVSSGQPGTQKNLNTGIVGNIDFPAINFQEQQQIAALLTIADKEIETLQQKFNYLKQEKKALMQQLLTGKQRVKVDN